jgi:hypothetical protein
MLLFRLSLTVEIKCGMFRLGANTVVIEPEFLRA